MTNSRNPSPKNRWSSALDLVRPAFVLLHLVLLPVALLGARDQGGAAEREASEVRQEQDRAGSPRYSTHSA